MERERLGSRLGFILLSAGCAIGVGNVWKFPWMAGQYGGGAFVLRYIMRRFFPKYLGNQSGLKILQIMPLNAPFCRLNA